ncbi:hypothetical protein CFP65_3268 [Kitasatospora sp. MMS16-BH015]|uniref:hypothetical protein n=1 Tax=Kitasatospora sp. MMS16-BH015 TaxID=2018025 RepID=UPI000CA38993|nr:hypothetical protein [Kitasatospora sp. MMS16-BH015]AUG78069.1 hypothetical protein CFP65_3268 [Kitasatospora sp. MMS16-BH015]
MIKVRRTRLDSGAPAVVRATDENLVLTVDDRHITATGAAAIETALNGLADGCPGPGGGGDS